MFDLKKNKNYPPYPPGTEPVQENVSLHTMRDDLDSARGENTAPEGAREEIPQSRPAEETTPIGSQPPAGYSPFLNTAGLEVPSVSGEGPELPGQPKHIPKWSRVILWSSLVIAFVALVVAGYYFWITRMTPVPPPPVLPAIPEPVIIEKEEPKFSVENPNYLPIDTEKDTAQTIQQLLIKTAAEVKETGISAPIEFVVVDQNNNPISLSIFSILSGLKLAPVLDNLEEGFSLLICLDSENSRMGLAADLKDKPKVTSAMTTKEKTLVNDVSFLLLGEIPQKTKGAFSINDSKSFPIRYLNIDASAEGSLSVDYSLTDKQLIIATSKNTMWAILDKVGKEERK